MSFGVFRLLMKKLYEAWADESECDIVFGTVESIEAQRSQGLLSGQLKLLHRVEAHI